VVTLAAAVVVAAVGALVVADLTRREHAATDRELRAAAARLAQPARRAVRIPALAARPAGPLVRAAGGVSVRVLRDGRTVFDDGRAPDVPVPAADGLATVAGWRVLTHAAGARGRLVLAAPLGPVDARVRDLRRDVVLIALAGLLALALIVRAVAARALAPLQRLRESATRVSTTHDLTARLDAGGGPEEIDDVTRALNAMLGRLEASLAAARRFTADAGHELRTPLTSVRANLATLAHADLPPAEHSRVLHELDEQQGRLAALLDALQALARGDAGAAPRHVALDLADLADAAVADARRRHPDVDFELDAPPEAHAGGDPAGLRAALDNLLENAARHGARTVRVRVEPHRLIVDDDGPGIPPADRERVFERFARGARATAPGSGLGLAIVAQQAELHGGRAHATGSPLGGARLVLDVG
jgi:two-component system sensor histidine kinase PrrB